MSDGMTDDLREMHAAELRDEARHYRRAPSWWDAFEVPAGHTGAHLRTWLDENAPHPEEHDYVLYTDGSGCTRGWGAYAAIIEEIGPVTRGDELAASHRGVVWQDLRVGGTFGATVNRSEMEAFLSGMHAIMSRQLCKSEVLSDEEENDDPSQPKLGSPLSRFSGNDRTTVLWYTDRENLAKSLLFGADGNTLYSRNKERDLWLRFSSMARHVCVTPMPTPRNSVAKQAVTDALCTLARSALVSQIDEFERLTQGIIPSESWKTTKNQRAMF